jgi:glyoxylase-like metal-dependent hydrolase (beta-lactamase superfamily II)
MQQFQLARDLTVHVHASGEGGIFANAYLVETPGGVVVVDATLSETESRTLRAELTALGKPLLAVLVTHPHPDHVAGITNLVGTDDAKIVATRPVLDLMRRMEEPKRKQWGPVFGDEWVPRWTYPNTVVQSGDTMVLGGTTFSVLDLGPGGDSEANTVWFIDQPRRTAFVGDAVFNGVHSYAADGHLLAWLAGLGRLEQRCADMDLVFPGHGAPAHPNQLFPAQRAYLLTLVSHVHELADGRPELTDGAKQELARRMQQYLPGGGLAFLIAMNADPIARELTGGMTP